MKCWILGHLWNRNITHYHPRCARCDKKRPHR